MLVENSWPNDFNITDQAEISLHTAFPGASDYLCQITKDSTLNYYRMETPRCAIYHHFIIKAMAQNLEEIGKKNIIKA